MKGGGGGGGRGGVLRLGWCMVVEGGEVVEGEVIER